MGDGLGTIGLAYRAGKLAAGDTAVGDAVRTKHARLICTASDLGDRARERAEEMREQCNALYLHTHLTKAELGGALGRDTCGIIAFTDPGLAAAFAKALAAIRPDRYGEIAEALSGRQETALRRKDKKRRRDGQNQARGGRMNG